MKWRVSVLKYVKESRSKNLRCFVEVEADTRNGAIEVAIATARNNPQPWKDEIWSKPFEQSEVMFDTGLSSYAEPER